jgi:hypothetical protein
MKNCHLPRAALWRERHSTISHMAHLLCASCVASPLHGLFGVRDGLRSQIDPVAGVELSTTGQLGLLEVFTQNSLGSKFTISDLTLGINRRSRSKLLNDLVVG